MDALLAIAEETGVTPGEVAIAWVLARGVLPIIGPRTPQQLAGNPSALEVTLADGQLRRLDAASAIALGFPHEVVAATAPSLFGGRIELVDRPDRGVR